MGIWEYIGGASVTGTVAIIILLLNRMFDKRDKKQNNSNECNDRISELESGVKEIKNSVRESKLDRCRIQLLIMMNHYPNEVTEIMRLGEYYFVTLQGDWYMTSLFNQWLVQNGIGKPGWFSGESRA